MMTRRRIVLTMLFAVGLGIPAPQLAGAQEFKPYWVQTHQPTELWSATGSTAISFGQIRTWSYLEVRGPQQGARLYVWNPLTKGTAYVDARSVGPAGAPSESYLRTGLILKRTIQQPARVVGRATVRSSPEIRDGNEVGTLAHNNGVTVLDEVSGPGDESWYRIAPDQFVHGDAVRMPREPAERYPGRWIDADLADPSIIALYEGDKLVDMALAIKGTRAWETPRGTFTILRRVANETMNSETIGIPRDAAGGYYLKDVLFTQYFTGDGSSFHYNYWSGNFGYAGSHGCLGLGYDDALFLWHWADVGTVVHIHD